MTAIRITTENPNIEQWRLLSQFSYPGNIVRYLQSRGFKITDDVEVELIAGCIRQGEAYFKAAENSPLDILPLLLYYGTTNLLIGASVLLTNTQPIIKNHGMVWIDVKANRIADVQVLPRNPKEGASQQFSNIFSRGCLITCGASWSMGEILGSIPDLKHDFENHYQDLDYYTIPVEIVLTRQKTVERISLSELQRFENPKIAITQILNFNDAYLAPQYKPDYVILFRKRKSGEIGTYSISGRKHLQLGHLKNKAILNPHQLILFYMGLFILGFLPRYRPELWNPFVRNDTTGEKYIIEKYLSICQRYIPNLVLNFLYGARIQFVNENEGIIDLTASLEKRDLQAMIRESLKEMHDNGELR
jgi:hypothetical protein